MDARLLQRTTRVVKLTHEGELFLQYCQQVTDYVSAIENAQQIKSHNVQGEITLTSAIAFTQHFLAPGLVKSNQIYPDVVVNVIATDKVLNLVNDKIDFALRVTNYPDENLIGKKMVDFPLHLIASSDYLLQHGPIDTPDGLNNHKAIGYLYTKKPRWTFSTALAEITVEPTITFYASKPGVLARYAISAGGIALLPALITDPLVNTSQAVLYCRNGKPIRFRSMPCIPQEKMFIPPYGHFYRFFRICCRQIKTARRTLRSIKLPGRRLFLASDAAPAHPAAAAG